MHQGTLTILDQNDNSPIFELDGKAQFVIDTRWIGIGAELFRLRCHDPDDGPNGHITYSINSTFFGIDSETGIVRLIKFPNGLNQLQFHVTATDNGEQSRHSTMKIVVEIKEDETVSFFSIFSNLIFLRHKVLVIFIKFLDERLLFIFLLQLLHYN